MQTENNLGSDNIKRLVVRIALPSMLAQFVNVLYSIVDRMYIGNIPLTGDTALAGVGVCGPLVTLLSAFAYLIGTGGSPLLSIALGAGKEKEARRILSTCFSLLTGIALFATVLALAARRPLLLWFGASSTTYPYAEAYFSVYLLGTVFALLSLGMNQFIICQGFAKTGMKSVLLGAALNLLLDPVFIFLLDLGVKGAALATVLSQLASCLYVLRFLSRPDIPVPIRRESWDGRLVRKILSVGFTPFLIVAVDNVMILSMNALLQKYGGPARGDMLLTCATILQSFMLIVTMPLSGITTGTQTILGFNYGARNSRRVLEAEKYILLLCLAYTTLFFLLAHTLPQLFVKIFTRDPESVRLTVWAIQVYTLGVIPLGGQYMVVDGFTGMGIVGLALSLSFFRKLVFFVSLFSLPVFFDVASLFYAEPISDILGAGVSAAVYFLTIRRILKNREKAEEA